MNAAEKAYRHCRAGLVNYIARRIGSAQDAEDVAQDAFLRLMQSQRVEDIRQPAAYLNVIASHLIYDVHIRQRREALVFDSHLAELAADRAVDRATNVLADRLEIDQQLIVLLSRVPTLQAAIVVLQKGEGLSYREIARALGISAHTVKKYLCVALAQLRATGGAV
jgi:RNA polymerase sigma-70 factor (ECF subfamily)